MIKNFLKRWKNEEDGVAAMEAAFVFPMLCLLLLGTYDLGNALLVSQKVIRASQVTGDLVTRERNLSDEELNEAIMGGELALAPNSIASYCVDVVSIEFDDDSNPSIVWRETSGTGCVNNNVFNAVEPLAEDNGGVVVTTVRYTFEPLFFGFVGDMTMEEVAFTKGRKSAVVHRG